MHFFVELTKHHIVLFLKIHVTIDMDSYSFPSHLRSLSSYGSQRNQAFILPQCQITCHYIWIWAGVWSKNLISMCLAYHLFPNWTFRNFDNKTLYHITPLSFKSGLYITVHKSVRYDRAMEIICKWSHAPDQWRCLHGHHTDF